MDTYTPINKAILTSTIWGEKPHVRVLWLSMLISADRHGRVAGSIPGLARLAVLSLSECEEALAVLLAPDPYSRTKDYDGRRLIEIDGGWQILNHQKHKDLIDKGAQRNRERQARHREKRVTLRNVEVTQSNDQNQNQNQIRSDPPITPPSATWCESGKSESRSDADPELAVSEPVRLTASESLDATQPPEDQPWPKTRQRVSQAAKQPKEPKRHKPAETDPPDMLEPTEATLAAAAESRRDWRADWAQCRDWALSKGVRRLDWQATLRGWMRRNAEQSRSGQFVRRSAPMPPQPNDESNRYDPRKSPNVRIIE